MEKSCYCIPCLSKKTDLKCVLCYYCNHWFCVKCKERVLSDFCESESESEYKNYNKNYMTIVLYIKKNVPIIIIIINTY